MKKKRLRAAAFIDYEHWYISMEKIYHKKPDIGAWLDMINERADVREITFFADFSNESLSKEIAKIREYTNKIVDTKNPNPHSEKDFTDFIMLDNIYQKAYADDKTDVFILFTGDAHFYSVVAFLKAICRKQVGVYGIKGACSSQLKSTASWWVELPTDLDIFKPYYDMILKNIRYLEHNLKPDQSITFRNTVQSVADHYSADKEKVTVALQSLIESGYIDKNETKAYRKTVITLKTNWDKLIADGLWVAEAANGNLFIKKTAESVPVKSKQSPKPKAPAKRRTPAKRKTTKAK